MSGTAKTGFIKGEYGPFRCDNCYFWRAPMGCVEKDVIADPEVPKIKNGQGEVYARAMADDCCNHFTNRRPKLGDVKFDDVGL